MCSEPGCDETHLSKRQVGLHLPPCVYRRLMRVQEGLRGKGPQTVTAMCHEWLRERLKEEERRQAG